MKLGGYIIVDRMSSALKSLSSRLYRLYIYIFREGWSRRKGFGFGRNRSWYVVSVVSEVATPIHYYSKLCMDATPKTNG